MKISSYEIHISTEKSVKRAAEEKQMSRSFRSVQKVRKKEKVWQSGKRQQSRSHRGRFPPQPAMTTLKRLRSQTRSRNNNCGFIRRLLFVSAWHWFGRQNRDPTGCYITVQSIGKAKHINIKSKRCFMDWVWDLHLIFDISNLPLNQKEHPNDLIWTVKYMKARI